LSLHLLVLLAALATPAHRAAEELKGVPRCGAAAPAVPSDWKRTEVRDGFSIAMPACFEEAAEQPRFVHGGTVWRCNEQSVTVSWGMWGLSSFSDEAAKRCTATVGGVPALVMTSPDEVRIWYLTGTVHEPVVSVWSRKPEALAPVAPAAWSGRAAQAAQ